MRKAWKSWLVALAGMGVAGCDGANIARPIARTESLGGATIAVRTAGRTYVDEIQCVYVEISWPGLPGVLGGYPAIGGMMFNSNPGDPAGTWTFSAEKIPIGTVTIKAEAYNGPPGSGGCTGTKKFEGTTTEAISADEDAFITLYLQETSHADPFVNTAPSITTLFASSVLVAKGDVVTLSAQAADPDIGQILTYTWSLGDVPFSTGTSGGATWTVPTTAGALGPYHLKITVTDGAGGKAEATITVTIGLTGVDAVVRMNSWPRVTGIDASIVDGTSVAFVAHAEDADGDPLTYAWHLSPGCDGTLSSAEAAATDFTPGDGGGGTCTATVTVSDGDHGGLGTGSVTFTYGALLPSLGPQFVIRWLSPNTIVAPDGIKRAEVVAIPVDNVTSDKSFTWSDGDHGGTFAPYTGPFPNPDNSDMWYTPAACTSAGVLDIPITVTMTASGASNSATTILTTSCP